MRHILRAANSNERDWIQVDPLAPDEAFFCCIQYALARLRAPGPSESLGDYLEFGVGWGSTMAGMYRALEQEGIASTRLFGFGSFQGLPREAAHEGWMPGASYTPIEITQERLARSGVSFERTKLVKGWYRDTLNDSTRKELALKRASLIMINCDLYSSARDALVFSEPHIGRSAIILFHDWEARSGKAPPGQPRAFEEFLSEHPDIEAEPLAMYRSGARVFLLGRQRA